MDIEVLEDVQSQQSVGGDARRQGVGSDLDLPENVPQEIDL